MTTPGRPTAYRREFCELAHNYCLLGATNAELAGFFDVSPRTIDNWIASHPAFAEAVREGRVVADARVARCLYERAVGWRGTVERTVLHDGQERTLKNVVQYPPDTRACIFWLRNRRRGAWSEKNADGTGRRLRRYPAPAGRARCRGRTRPCESVGGTSGRAAPRRPSGRRRVAAQAARFFRASPMPSQLEPMNMRSMPRKMPSV